MKEENQSNGVVVNFEFSIITEEYSLEELNFIIDSLVELQGGTNNKSLIDFLEDILRPLKWEYKELENKCINLESISKCTTEQREFIRGVFNDVVTEWEEQYSENEEEEDMKRLLDFTREVVKKLSRI